MKLVAEFYYGKMRNFWEYENRFSYADMGEDEAQLKAQWLVDALRGEGHSLKAIRSALKIVKKRTKEFRHFCKQRANSAPLSGIPNIVAEDNRAATRGHIGVKYLTPMIERHIASGGNIRARDRRQSARLTIKTKMVRDPIERSSYRAVNCVLGPMDHAAEREARALDYIRAVSTRRYRNGRTLDRLNYEDGKTTRRKYAGYRRDEKRLGALIESIRAIHRSALIDDRTLAIFESVAIDDWQRAGDRIKRMADCIEPLGLVGDHPAALAIVSAFNPPSINERPSTRAERKARSEARRAARAAATVAQLSRLLASCGIDPAQFASELESAAVA